MENVDLEIWWSSLPVSEKERIARKGLSKAGDPDESKACYPACTVWWNALEQERKEFIYKHARLGIAGNVMRLVCSLF